MTEHNEDETVRATMDLTEVAKVLGCSRTSAYRWAKNGTLPAIRLGRRVLVPRAAVDAMLHPAPPTPQPAQPTRVPKPPRSRGEVIDMRETAHARGSLR
jgi:excisionase family DNA binding protein